MAPEISLNEHHVFKCTQTLEESSPEGDSKPCLTLNTVMESKTVVVRVVGGCTHLLEHE